MKSHKFFSVRHSREFPGSRSVHSAMVATGRLVNFLKQVEVGQITGRKKRRFKEPQITALPMHHTGSLTGTILLAEDNPIFSKVIRSVIEELGFQFLGTRNGKDLIEEVKKHPGFVAILMDMRMPVMDGPEATRRLRAGEAGEAGRSIPIIGLSASMLEADKLRCLSAGMDGYLTKCLLPEDLAASLRAAGVMVAATGLG